MKNVINVNQNIITMLVMGIVLIFGLLVSTQVAHAQGSTCTLQDIVYKKCSHTPMYTDPAGISVGDEVEVATDWVLRQNPGGPYWLMAPKGDRATVYAISLLGLSKWYGVQLSNGVVGWLPEDKVADLTPPSDDTPNDRTDVTNEVAETNKLVTGIREKIEALRTELHEKRGANSELLDSLKAKRQTERQTQRGENRTAFEATLVGLDDTERKAAIVNYIEALKAEVAAKKEEYRLAREARQDTKADELATFKASLEGLTQKEKLAAIQERLRILQSRAEERGITIQNNLDAYGLPVDATTHYGVGEVDAVESEQFGDVEVDGGYTLYAIMFKDGSVKKVKIDLGGTFSMTVQKFRESGYTGDVQTLIDMATQPSS